MSYYGTESGFEAYCEARGITPAAGDVPSALTRTSDYIDGEYRASFPGYKTGGYAQDREWPRVGATDREGYAVPSDTTPVAIENATYAGALRELTTPGSLAPDIKPGGGVIKRVKAGSVEVEYESNSQTQKTFQAIEQALGPLLVVRSSYSGAAARA